MSLATRAAVVALVLFIEKSLLNLLVDFDSAQRAQGLGAAVRIAQHWGFRFAVTLAALLALFAYVRDDERLGQINSAAREWPLSLSRLLWHLALVLPLVPLSYFLYGSRGAPLPFVVLVALWVAFASAATLVLLASMAPWFVWARSAKAMGSLWPYAAAAAATATCAMQWSQQLWRPTAAVTFDLVRSVLTPLIPTLHADPASLILSTSRFAVQVSDECSGLEGAGLMLAFCCAWLVYFRREYIFPRALLLIPVGLVLIFVLNTFRIVALMLIGHVGLPRVAVYGFHSQAGWIAFNCAAGGIAFASLRSPWLNRTAAQPALLAADNRTAAYLLPFLAILASGMVSLAASSGFETWYGLRLIAGTLALVYCWPKLSGLDWHFSWRGLAAGAGIFAVWIFGARFFTASSGMPAALAAMSPGLRALWIVSRIAASVIVVPIAEELAYRGYLLRRIAAADFECVPFAQVGGWALLVSSVVFGVGHGSMWLPGIIAGVIYGALAIRTGRLGEAVVAHATTNALIAGYVLLRPAWQLW